jgi:hypothetical protein
MKMVELKFLGAELKPFELQMDDGARIPAGTIFLVPFSINDEIPMPEGTILLAGQKLRRSLYPQLSPLYTAGGGFYDFELPDFENKVTIDFINGVAVKASLGIYYQDMPHVKKIPRSIDEIDID